MRGKPMINIKKENRGKFTETCKRWGYSGVTGGCIAKAKSSNSPILRKRATFAENARRWNR